MAAEMVGGAFLSAFVNTLFDRMASPEMVDFIKGIKQNNGPELLEKLKITLRSVDAIFNHAEERQTADTHIREWLNDLKDAMFKAEDLLDEITTTASSEKLEAELQGGRSKVHFYPAGSLRQFIKGMEKILEKLENLQKQKDVLGLRDGVYWIPSTKFLTTSLPGKSLVYGRDADKESIIKLCLSCDDSDDVCVIPIVGTGGVGKTTLAQLVYNDDMLKEHFDIKLWVCVTQELDLLQLTRTILEAIPLTCDTMNLNQQQIKLKEFLHKKKFLVVLDDVWIENYVVWEHLQRPFEFGARGSKILVTTRSQNVASALRTVQMHHLKPLTEDDCWLLFAHHAFDGGKLRPYSKMEDIGRKIVRKCGGLPLAAKALGGLLRSKPDIGEWEKVLESSIWDFPFDICNILPALMLTYHYLPSPLKRCFAYCSIFPKNYQFRKRELVRHWMAENLLQRPRSNEGMEEVGIEYFNDLVARSFFHHSSKEHFILHDLLNDLAQFVSGEFSFRLQGENRRHMTNRTRYLSYSKVKFQDLEKIMATCENLRSFIPSHVLSSSTYLNNETVSGLLPKVRRLRELSLSHCDNLTILPDSLGDLIHLRYLDLSFTKISKLPESTGYLYNLQTLLLTNCSFLIELPRSMGRLINLRSLDIRGTTKLSQMPPDISRLRNLRKLTAFALGHESGSGIKQLKELMFLKGDLSIFNLQNIVDPQDAMDANLMGKEQLTALKLKWRGDVNDSREVRSVLDQLQPPKTLRKLTIEGYGSTSFPAWLGDSRFSNITSMSLHDCKNCMDLPPLGALPSLAHLSIVGFQNVISVGDMFYKGPSSVVAKPFGSLRTLRFENLPQWQDWLPFGDGDADGTFSQLQQLCIINCPILIKGLPDKLPSLRKLVINKCQQFVAALPCTVCDLQLEYCEQVSTKEPLPQLLNLKISGLDALESLFGQIDKTSSCIEKLSISSCPHVFQLPGTGIAYTLKSLNIVNCRKLEFPTSQCFTLLASLCIKFSCDSLQSFMLNTFPKLSHLEIEGCQYLESLAVSGADAQCFPSLHSLRISGCPNFVSFPNRGLPAPNLTHFLIENCKKLKSLPDHMNNLLPSLATLKVGDCEELETFPKGGLPKRLNFLEIFHCAGLFANRRNWDLPTSLRSFGVKGTCKDGEVFPETWLLPSSLTSLYIRKLNNLKSLNEDGLQHLTSLEHLGIGDCSELQYMPEKLPFSLSALHIWNCPLLEQRCKGEKSEDWPKVCHIPLIRLNRKLIRYES